VERTHADVDRPVERTHADVDRPVERDEHARVVIGRPAMRDRPLLEEPNVPRTAPRSPHNVSW